MTGRDSFTSKKHSGWFRNLFPSLHRYIAVDGGTGSHLFAQLAGRDPSLQQVSSPRHANLLLVATPISQKLAPAIVAMAKALVQPAHVLLLDAPDEIVSMFPSETFAPVEDLFPEASHVSRNSIDDILRATHSSAQWSTRSIVTGNEPDAATFSLPPREDMEMATELAVLSLGPLQPFTSGPLRLLLLCDGEQVHSVQVEAGYAYRGIESAMTATSWQELLAIAHQLDPLAPLAGHLAYVHALEQLQGWQSPEHVRVLRNVALALERVQNTFWWLVRFARLLDDVPLFQYSSHLAADLTLYASEAWKSSPLTWIQPQQVMSRQVIGRIDTAKWRELADRLDLLKRHVESSRCLALRTRGIGVLTRERLEEADVLSGPIFQASDTGNGDVESRLLVRLHMATQDIAEVSDALAKGETAREHASVWDVPEGDARVTVQGPRGAIGLRLVSYGGTGPSEVEWHRPSAALLRILPDLLRGQKLADAEVTLASLDLAMAEADG